VCTDCERLRLERRAREEIVVWWKKGERVDFDGEEAAFVEVPL